MAFGLHGMSLTPAQILQDEAQKRSQAIQQQQFAQQIAEQRRAQAIQAEQFAQTLAANEARTTAVSESSKATGALDLAKWNAEQAWTQGSNERAIALETAKANIPGRPKQLSPEEEFYTTLTPEQKLQKLFKPGQLTPEQEAFKALSPADQAEKVKYHPPATGAESASLLYAKEKDVKELGIKTNEAAGKLKMALAVKGFPMADKTKLPVTGESMRAFLLYSGQNPDDPMWQPYYAQAEAIATQQGTGLTKWQRAQNAFRPKAHEIKRPGQGGQSGGFGAKYNILSVE